jgi:uncharacterized membrane protein YdbT with pleckstrin-like domain
MPYPQKNLNDSETIALDMHPHWWYFAEPALVLAGAIVIGLVVLFGTDSGSNWRSSFGWVAIAALVVAALWLVGRYVKWISTNFVITSQRLIFRQGIIAKTGIEIPLERVNNVNFSQGIIERMLGAGDLLIESGGEDGQQRFTDIRHPDQVQNLIHSQMEQVARRRGGYSASAAAPAAGASVPEQLERLEGLMQRGSITPDEYEAQKRKLLG